MPITQEKAEEIKKTFDLVFTATKNKEASQAIVMMMYETAKNVYLKEMMKEIELCNAFKAIDKEFAARYYEVAGSVKIEHFQNCIDSCDEMSNFLNGI